MTARYLDLLTSPYVKAAQEANGVHRPSSRVPDVETGPDVLTAREAEFIASRDSFYMATVGAEGWPYLQHRGGPAGFVKVLGPRQFGLADFRGNRQYISVGNLEADNRAAFFFMDYPRRARLKLLGRVRQVSLTDAPDLAAALLDSDYAAKVERGLLVDVEAYDWNCPQHITPRFSVAELAPSIEALKARIAELEGELSKARAG